MSENENDALREQLEGAVEALRAIRDNLGVPDENYPAPVAHAWKIADDYLTAAAGQ